MGAAAAADEVVPRSEELLAGDDLRVVRVRLAAGETLELGAEADRRGYLLVLTGRVQLSSGGPALAVGQGTEIAAGGGTVVADGDEAVVVLATAPKGQDVAGPAANQTAGPPPHAASDQPRQTFVGSALRATREDDLETVVAIEQSGDTARWLGPGGMEWHRRVLQDPKMEHWVLVDRLGQILGFGVLAGIETGPRVEIRRLAVLSEGRGQGLGRLLFRLLFQQAVADPGVTEVWLDVSSGNHRAINIYRGLGFVEEPRPDWAHLEEDGVFMRWSADR